MSKISIHPTEDGVLVRVLKRKNVLETASRVQVPEEFQADLQMSLCKVLACGPGRLLERGERARMPCKPGDVVILGSEPLNVHNEVDGETLGLAPAHAVRAVVVGVDLQNYEEGLKLHVLAARAQEGARQRMLQRARETGGLLVPTGKRGN